MSLVSTPTPLELDVLLAPFDPRQPAGVFDEEEESFQAIELEMVKLGGLHASSIDWAYVDTASRQYLVNNAKHFRVAGHLVVTRLRSQTWSAWADAAGLLAGMVERFWETGYPKPGTLGLPAKRKLLALQLERLGEALAGLAPASFAARWADVAGQALDSLHAHAEGTKLDQAQILRLRAKLSRRVSEMQAPVRDSGAAEATSKAERQVFSEEFFASAAGAQNSEREGRRSLLAVAELINRQDAYDPTGYQLRRFALWAHLTSAPPARDGRTELMAVPVDIVEGYQEALASNALKPVLLQRVEKSVTSSPYWIRGSYLASMIAERLEMPQVAMAIRHRTEHFLLRLPTLMDLQFSDGRPFVDIEVQSWVSGAGARDEVAAQTGSDFATLRGELTTCLGAGVEAFLVQIEQMQLASTSPRERCHTLTIAADLLHARGLKWLATSLYATAEQMRTSVSLEQWEPELFNHLARRVSP
ncbi:type VI secretion system protein TssA [Pseudomonas aeruginosa]|uniref:type VI secretion system protein TssA n=1 Tax=Pseudomonas aeruginosa TaxID=287 RepID=UPI0009406DBE|nr:type VI secretion system protein TssA [Pseudomonas aeruginosa]MCO3840211.1 type VI secretion system protein TssA [Pseudomonas aeruginosa]NPW39387.1 type VI secretion system protein TssA [Pseudomonas aeruginosa]HBP1183217.1 type VI secretion system protein TssA [Pseudomonas aeruginosa]HCL4171530.1 type VI secretion system protein TssA [Pseudomonas aeruginosa]HEP8173742.1 type VI secretion system protein TssA [Pseudomonas aeruginosa]